MIGFRSRFKVPPDQPGDPKIFLPRIVFLIPGVLLLGWGLLEAWRYFQFPAPAGAQSEGSRPGLNLTGNVTEMNLDPRTIAGICAVVFILAAALFLWLGILAEFGLRREREKLGEGYPAFISARKFALFAGLLGYLYFYGAVVGSWLGRFLPGFAVVLIWVISASALVQAILWYFEKRRRDGRKQ